MRIKNNIAVSVSGLVFNPDTGESFTVNPMGAEIIASLAEGESQQEIEVKIVGKYNVDKPSFEKDFEDFVDLLKTYSLLEND